MWCGPCYGHTNQQPLPKGPAEGGGRGEGFLGPYAHSRGLRDRTRPLYQPRPSILPPPIWLSPIMI